MKKLLKSVRVVAPILILSLPFAIWSCLSPLKKSEKLEFCNGNCVTFQNASERNGSLKEVYQFLRNNENKTIRLCDASSNKKECRREGLLGFWQGGVFPGPAYMDTIKIKETSFDSQKQEIGFELEFKKKSFLWIPFVCASTKANVMETVETNMTMTGSGAFCNWMGMGIFVLNLYVSIDYIDLNKGWIAGNYKYNGGGPLNGGGATGYMLMDFNQTEVAKN